MHLCQQVESGGDQDVVKPLFYPHLVLGNSLFTKYMPILFQLAKQYHPDMNNKDPNGAKKFQEVSEAYEVTLHSKSKYSSNLTF